MLSEHNIYVISYLNSVTIILLQRYVRSEINPIFYYFICRSDYQYFLLTYFVLQDLPYLECPWKCCARNWDATNNDDAIANNWFLSLFVNVCPEGSQTVSKPHI